MDELDQVVEKFNDTTSQETTSTEAEEAASATEEAAGDETPAASSEESSEESGKEQSAQGRSPKLQKIIDEKYGGDEEKFTESVYESWNSGSRLKGELDDLKAKVGQFIEAQPKEIPDDHPDLEEVNEEIADLKARQTANDNSGRQTLTELGKIDREIARAEGQLEKAEDFEKARLEQKLLALEAKQQVLLGKWESSQDKSSNLERELKAAARKAESTKKDVAKGIAEAQRQQREELVLKERTLKEFFTTLEEAAKQVGIPKENLGHLASTVRGELVLYLRSLSDDAPDVNIPQAVKARVTAYGKAMGIGKKPVPAGQKVQIAQTGKVPPGKGTATQPPPKPDKELKFQTAAEAKAWTAKMLP